MILLDITNINEDIKEGDILNINFTNNYKDYTDNNELFNNEFVKRSSINKKIVVTEFLGEGSYGKVYKIKINNNYYALKLNQNEIPDKLFDRYQSLISHNKLSKYVINIFCAGELKFNSSFTYYSIMEYGGNSVRNLLKNENSSISALNLIDMLKKIYNIVHICHKYRILMTDFKLGNLTINSSNDIKLIDLYMYCDSYDPCTQCKIVKTYTTVEIEKEKRIYENPDYNYSCIFIPFAVCLIDILCASSTSHYCTKISKKYDIDLNVKQILPLIQISCYNYSNETNLSIKSYKYIYSHKKNIENKYPIIKNKIFYEYFMNLLEPKKELGDWISKKKLLLIVNDLFSLDPDQRSLKFLKNKFK